jgi:spore maturation protein CgeB
MAGFSPSVRLFEAAACGTAIVSDNWAGLDEFFVPGKEILIASCGDDTIRYLSGYDTMELKQIGDMARHRVTLQHTNDLRAGEFERAVEAAGTKRRPLVAAKF